MLSKKKGVVKIYVKIIQKKNTGNINYSFFFFIIDVLNKTEIRYQKVRYMTYQ